MESLHWNSVVRGHHVYKDIWTPFVGEILHVEQEDDNPEDCFAVCIALEETISLAMCHEKFHTSYGISLNIVETSSFSSLV